MQTILVSDMVILDLADCLGNWDASYDAAQNILGGFPSVCTGEPGKVVFFLRPEDGARPLTPKGQEA
jgi:hypothetical protein